MLLPRGGLDAAVVVLALSLLAACDGASDPGPDGGEPRVELGTGVSSFTPLPDGSDIELVAGPQGGWHVFLTARLYQLELEGLRLEYEADPVEDGLPTSETAFVLDANDVVPEDDHYLRAGDFLVQDISEPADIVGMEVDLTVRAIEAGGGLTVEDSRRVRIVDEVAERPPG